MGPFHPPPRTEEKAVASLVLGIASLPSLGLTALPAIILGAMARRDIDRSQGRLEGSAIAAGGIVTGLFGTGVGVLALLLVLGGAIEHVQHRSTRHAPADSETRTYGAVDVVDLDADRPLRAQLGVVVRDARARGRTVVLLTHVPESPRCAQIAAALPDRRMQRALANVTLVRADVGTFDLELRAMRVDTGGTPWFYKLDGAALPTDAMSADELDTALPEKMAPALARFVRGINAR
jgi:hypothetical protein